MIGDIRSEASLSGNVNTIGSVSGQLKTETVLADVIIGKIEIIRRNFPDYDGEYEATPTVEEQTFPTKQTSMIDDFIVHKIPYYETSNPSGGYTAIIGG